ncbi:MAG: nitroreductase family protein [Thermoplasmata archaeon]|nr:MAG: nitroreductase family protein [Thermoplasmata archaeon]
MEVREAIEKRKSTRNFLSVPLPVNVVREILRFANMAPSAGNLQARDFIIVNDEEKKKALARAAHQAFVKDAPVIIVACANYERIAPYGERGRNLYVLQDVAAAIQNILLLATDYGLGTCWVGAFDEKAVSNILSLPPHIRPLALIPIGYASMEERKTGRMVIDDLLHFNKWEGQ